MIIGFNLEGITVIDDGDYQGTQIFIIPLDTYQPNVNNYVYTHTYYGSCCGCDTLQAIIYSYDDDIDDTLEIGGKPNENQIKEYMQLALHLLQKMKWLGDEEK